MNLFEKYKLGLPYNDFLQRHGTDVHKTRWKQVQVNAGQPVVAPVDPPRFEQVLTNMVENALKYSSQQTPVRVELWSDNGEAHISVQDEGIGIPEDGPDRIGVPGPPGQVLFRSWRCLSVPLLQVLK